MSVDKDSFRVCSAQARALVETCVNDLRMAAAGASYARFGSDPEDDHLRARRTVTITLYASGEVGVAEGFFLPAPKP